MAESGVQPAGADLSYTLKYPGSHRATFGDPGVARGGRRELRRHFLFFGGVKGKRHLSPRPGRLPAVDEPS